MKCFLMRCIAFITISYSLLSAYSLETLYGSYTFEEEILSELLENPFFKRLEKIHQYGIDEYVIKKTGYTRAQHSKGVLALLIHYKASLAEQVAGLLHDISHTVFSHVGDLVFDHEDGKSSYQDDNHQWFLEQTSIPILLHKYHLTISDIHHKHPSFTCLEAPLPQLCVDRLEYNLMGGYIEGLITQEEIIHLLNHLHFENGVWFFDDISYAKKLGEMSLYLTAFVWADPKGKWVDFWAAQALKQALKIGYITLEEIHFATDDEIWNKLHNSQDSLIYYHLHLLRNYEIFGDGTFITPGKFRGINPLVKTAEGIVSLTTLDSIFKNLFEEIRQMYPLLDYNKGKLLIKRHLNL